MLTVKDKNFVPFIEKQALEERIAEVGREISEDYRDKNPLFVVVLNGSFMFAAELMKNVSIACEITFVRVSSYSKTESTGELTEILGLKQSIHQRHVIIVEDIVDTGNTIEELKAILKEHNVKHFKIATLFLKPEAYKKDIKLDYVGIRIPNKFIVGYGLDYDGLGRNLKDVYQLSEN